MIRAGRPDSSWPIFLADRATKRRCVRYGRRHRTTACGSLVDGSFGDRCSLQKSRKM